MRLQLESFAFVPLHKIDIGSKAITIIGIVPQEIDMIALYINNSEGTPQSIQPEISTHQGILPPAKEPSALPSSSISPIGSY